MRLRFYWLSSTLLAVLLLLCLAAPLRAQDALDGRFEPTSEVLGSGDYKVAFGVAGHPDLVMTIAKYDDATSTFMKEKLAREKSDLERLAKAGVPVATVEAIGTYKGKAALVMKRYATGTKAPDWAEKSWSLLDETSLRDLDTIERALTASGLEIQDLQFLVGADGHVVVADPEAVGEHVNTPSDVKKTIDAYRRASREAIAWRSLAAKLRAMPGADDERFRDLFALREVTAAFGDPAANAKVVSALVDWLASGETTDAARKVVAAIRNGSVKVATDGRWEGYAADEVYLGFAGPFPKLAATLVKNVVDEFFGGHGDDAARELLAKKGAPAELSKDFGSINFEDAARTARESGSALDPTKLRDRGGEPSRTTGIGGGLERLVDERAKEGVERGER